MFSLGTIITALFALAIVGILFAVIIAAIIGSIKLAERYEWTKYITISIGIILLFLMVCVEIQYGDVVIHFPLENL